VLQSSASEYLETVKCFPSLIEW